MSQNLNPPAPAPCKECPFRRTSPRGWLGGTEIGLATEYVQEAHSDRDINCHMVHERSCSGLAIYRQHVCKQPRGGSALVAVQAVAEDRETVFASPKEFLEHHDTPVNRSHVEKIRSKIPGEAAE